MNFDIEKSDEILSNFKQTLSRRGKQLQQKLLEKIPGERILSFEEVKSLSPYLADDELNALYHEYLINYHKYQNGEEGIKSEILEEEFQKKVDELVASSIIIKKMMSKMDFKKFTRFWIGKDKKTLEGREQLLLRILNLFLEHFEL